MTLHDIINQIILLEAQAKECYNVSITLSRRFVTHTVVNEDTDELKASERVMLVDGKPYTVRPVQLGVYSEFLLIGGFQESTEQLCQISLSHLFAANQGGEFVSSDLIHPVFDLLLAFMHEVKSNTETAVELYRCSKSLNYLVIALLICEYLHIPMEG
jgi:hypothetical protein